MPINMEWLNKICIYTLEYYLVINNVFKTLQFTQRLFDILCGGKKIGTKYMILVMQNVYKNRLKI